MIQGMFLQRVLTALIGIPLVIGIIWYGGPVFALLLLAISIVGIAEMNRLWDKVGSPVYQPLTLLFGFLYILVAYMCLQYGYVQYKDLGIGFVLFFSFFASTVWLVLNYPKFKMNNLSATVFTPLYVAWFLTFLLDLQKPLSLEYL